MKNDILGFLLLNDNSAKNRQNYQLLVKIRFKMWSG